MSVENATDTNNQQIECRDELFGKLYATIEFALEEAHMDTGENTITRFQKFPASTYATLFSRLMPMGKIRGIIERECNDIVTSINLSDFKDKPLKAEWVLGYSKQRQKLNKIFEIKHLRQETGLSQDEFGKFCGDIPKRTIQNWETGVSTPPEYVIKLIKDKIRLEKSLKE